LVVVPQPIGDFRHGPGGDSSKDAAGHNDLCETVHVRREHSMGGSPITGVLEGFDDLAAEEHEKDGDRYDTKHGASHQPAPVRYPAGLL
jgi:hypothetical protein